MRCVDEAERAEPLLGRVGGQGAGSGQGVEDRREEQSLVDRSHRTLMVPLRRLELLQRTRTRCVAIPEHARESQSGRFVGRDGVGLLLVPELEPVLDGAEERVGLGETRGVGAFHVAGGRELLESVECRGGADGRVVAPVDELQELHRELDVAYPAATALELPLAQSLALELRFGSRLHRSCLVYGVRVEDVGPHEASCELHEPCAEGGVTGYRAGLDECLELPRSRPTLVPRRVAVDRARERAGPTLGPQVGVGAEHDPVLGRGTEDRQDRPSDAVGLLRCPVVHEEHVDVAGVVQFRAPQLAHPDHCEGEGGRGKAQGGVETDLREDREFTADGRKVCEAEEIASRDPHVLAPPSTTQCPCRVVGRGECVVDRPSEVVAGPLVANLLTLAERVEQLGVVHDRGDEGS